MYHSLRVQPILGDAADRLFPVVARYPNPDQLIVQITITYGGADTKRVVAALSLHGKQGKYLESSLAPLPFSKVGRCYITSELALHSHIAQQVGV